MTVTSTVPPLSAGALATICVPESLTMVPALVPKSTAVAKLRFEPVIVTWFPVITEPEAGLMPERVGGKI